MRANPSSNVRTPNPNPNLQQSVNFASHQNGEFSLQQGGNIPTQQPQIQQQMVPCTPLQHPNQIVEEWNSSMSPYHYERLLPYQIMCKNAMAVGSGLQIAIGSLPTT